MMLKSRGSADLLLEIVISTIIFFIVVIVLFGIRLPQLEYRAHATVYSVDSALVCSTTLTNLLRTEENGIPISEFLSRGSYDDFNKTVTKLLDSVFTESGGWDLAIVLPNGTSILNIPKLKATSYAPCKAFVPFNTTYTQTSCLWSKTLHDIQHNNDISFESPDGKIVCTIINDGTQFGVRTGSKDCPLDLKPKTLFEESLPATIEDSTDCVNAKNCLDTISLPLNIKGIQYELTLTETSEEKADVTLARAPLIDNCGLTVMLKIGGLQ
ncbi:MAG: hypothetical protein QW063_00490 [Candidatus Nanoarchaeia archaeon]